MKSTDPITFTITPEQFCRERGWDFKLKRGQLQVRYCPFCGGGRSRTKWSFALNAKHGAYSCFKGGCLANAGGSFWNLLEHAGYNPTDYIDRSSTARRSFTKSTTTKETKDMAFKSSHNFAHDAKNPGAALVGGAKKVFKTPYTQALPLNDISRAYLENERLLSADTLAQWGIASKQDGGVLLRYWEGRDAGGNPIRHVFSKHRLPREAKDGEKKASRDADGKAILYGVWLCDTNYQNLTIMAGEYGAMSVWQSGVRDVVSLPSGDNDHEFVDLQWDWLDKWECITLWMDADASGQKALHELAKRLRRERCKQVNDTGYKDANDMLRGITSEHGIDAAHEAIRLAVANAADYQMEDLVDLADYVEEQIVESDENMLTRWGAIDAVTKGIHPGDFYVVFGDNASGKSTAMGNMLCERLESGGKALLYSGEMSAIQCGRWVHGMLAGPANIDEVFDKASGATDFIPKAEVLTRIRDWHRGRLWFYKKFGALDLDSFFEACEYAVRRYGISMIVIDSLTTAVGNHDGDMYSQQGIFAGRCRQFAEEFGCAVFLLMHQTADSIRDGQDQKPPTKGAIRGAHDVTDWATHILGVWRVPGEVRNRIPTEKKPNHFYQTDNVLVLLKNRDRGETVTARMVCDKKSTRLYMQATPAQANRRYGWETAAPAPAISDDPLPEPLAVSAAPLIEPEAMFEPFQSVPTETAASLIADDEWDAFLEAKAAAGELPPPAREEVWIGEIPF